MLEEFISNNDKNAVLDEMKNPSNLPDSPANTNTATDLWSFILNGISEIFIFYNPDLTVNWANKAVSDFLKKDLHDFSNISCREIWHIDSNNCLKCPLIRAKETLLPQEGEIKLNNGATWLIRAYPLLNENKNLTGFAEFAKDITQNKIAEQTAMQNEQRMRLALVAAQSGAWDWNLITGEAWWSPEMYELWGVEPGTIMNTENSLEIVDPRDCEKVKKNIFESIAEHKNLHYEFRIRHSTKGERWMATSGKVIYDETGKAIRIVGISSDITETRLLQETQKKTEKKYRTLHETMRDAFVSVDMSGKITEFNQAFIDLVGYSKEEIPNLTYQQLTPEKWHSFEEEIVQNQILPNGYSTIYEKEYRRKDGTIIPVELRTYLIRDDNGEPKNMWAIVRDISERKKAESALKASEECLRLKLNFLLSPDINISDLEIRNILDIPAIQALMDDFYATTGLGIGIIDLKGEILVATGWQDICTKFHRINPESRRNCIISDTYLTQNIKAGKFHIYKCANNLWDVATPLFIGKKHIANIFFGQFFFDDEIPDKNLFTAQAEKYGFEKEKYLAALDNVPRISREKVNSLMDFYSKFATLISKLSFSNIKLAKSLSEQKAIEEKLRIEQKKAEQYLDITPSIIINLDKNGNINLLNKHGASILECEQKDAIGRNWFEAFLPSEIRDSVKEVFDLLMNGNTITYKHYENEVITAKGNRKIIRWHNRILKSESGETIGILTSGEDITEQKKYEEELRLSEQRYRMLFDAGNDAIFVHTMESNGKMGLFTEVNDVACNRLGYSRDELLRMSPGDIDAEEMSPNRKIIVSRLLSEKQATFEMVHKAKDGRRIPVEINSRIIEIDGAIYVISIARDITERIENENKLKQSEERYRQLVENIDDLVYSVDKNGILTYLSPAVKPILGYTEDEGLGKHFSLFIHPDDLGKVQEIFENALKGHTKPAEFRIIDKKGSSHIIYLTAQPIFDENKITGFSGIISDITQKRRLEDEKFNMQKQLLHAQKLESLGVLAGGIAHDFNNLLMAILGNLDIAIHNPMIPSSANLSIQQAVNAAHRATDLTHQMLAYAGRSTIVNREIDLSSLVEENAHLLKVSIHKTITLDMNLAEDIPYISADAGQLQQIVMNLITNASDAIGEKAGVISITTGAMECDKKYLSDSRIDEKPPEGKFVYLEVEDTGCGMNEETLQRLFDPFFTTKFTGRGLGMSAFLGIVRSHKGAIIVKSKVNEGTTIRLLFPALETKTSDEKTSNKVEKEKANVCSFISGTFLVVDDEDVVREVCKSMVELLGGKVLTASNGEEAVEVFRKNNPEIDCVILDLSMPLMDGIAALVELRKINPEIKVLLSSGFSETEAMQRFMGHGITGFIQKPYNLQDLEKTLTSIIATV